MFEHVGTVMCVSNTHWRAECKCGWSSGERYLAWEALQDWEDHESERVCG